MRCAIDTLAEEGYARASLSRIADRAGISKSVIVYHFGGKDEVFEQVAAEVTRAATEVVGPRLAAEKTARGRLRTYLEARIGFLATHRQYMLALFEIWISLRTSEGDLRFGEADARATVEAIERILLDGQRSGEFGSFSAPVVAMVIRQAVDGVALRLRAEPDLDLDSYARELVAFFDQATRRKG